MFQFVSSIQIYKQVKGEVFPKFYLCVNLRLKFYKWVLSNHSMEAS